MDAAKLFEGIALLIELAQRGEIDPWDVQVIDVIDRYLGEFLPAQEAAPVACEADLSQSGQAFLSASMLVLFKANTLFQLQTPAEPDHPEEILLQAEHGGKERLHLEQQLRRRPAALPPRKRRVTLQELVEQLQLMATQLQSQEARVSTKSKHKRSLESRSRAEAARVIAQLAHQENLTEVAGELEQFLNRRPEHLDQDWLNLEQLVQLWTQGKRSNSSSPHFLSSSDDDLSSYSGVEEHSQRSAAQQRSEASRVQAQSPQTYDRVSVFWALLLLSAQSKVELSQEEFYQEIKIRTSRSGS